MIPPDLKDAMVDFFQSKKAQGWFDNIGHIARFAITHTMEILREAAPPQDSLSALNRWAIENQRDHFRRMQCLDTIDRLHGIIHPLVQIGTKESVEHARNKAIEFRDKLLIVNVEKMSERDKYWHGWYGRKIEKLYGDFIRGGVYTIQVKPGAPGAIFDEFDEYEAE